MTAPVFPSSCAAISGCTLGVEALHSADEQARELAEQCTVSGEQSAPSEQEGQHSLAQVRLGQDSLHRVCARRTHASAQARGAEPAAFACERHELTVFA